MAHRAIPFVDDGVLRDLLASHTDEVLAGAHFPDAGYGSSSFPGGDFGEVTHWERFVNAHAAHLRGRADCAPLRDPSGPCASQVAHLMGIAAHGMGDEMWDWLFEPQMADYGEWAHLRDQSREFLTPWEPVWPGWPVVSYRSTTRSIQAWDRGMWWIASWSSCWEDSASWQGSS